MGSGTLRFKSTGQIDGSERSVIYKSGFNENVSSQQYFNDNSLFNAAKSYIKVVSNTSALHQVMLVRIIIKIFICQSPFLSVNSTTGLEHLEQLLIQEILIFTSHR